MSAMQARAPLASKNGWNSWRTVWTPVAELSAIQHDRNYVVVLFGAACRAGSLANS